MECVNAILNAADDKILTTMLFASGKGLNDLGDMEFCDKNEKTTYGIVRVQLGPVYGALGVCLPATCSQDSLSIVNDALSQMIMESGMQGSAEISIV